HAVGGHHVAGVAPSQRRVREDPVGHSLHLGSSGHWVAVRPPSIVSICPVMNDEASEQNRSVAPIRSSVSPTRRNGIRSTMPALKSGSSRSIATWGVSTKVGEMAFTVIPYFAHSVAHCRVRESIAPLAAT